MQQDAHEDQHEQEEHESIKRGNGGNFAMKFGAQGVDVDTTRVIETDDRAMDH